MRIVAQLLDVNGTPLATTTISDVWIPTEPGGRSHVRLEFRPELAGQTFEIHPAIPLTLELAAVE
jgi:hypothetical protein